jgi:hypothetical protein
MAALSMLGYFANRDSNFYLKVCLGFMMFSR